MNVRYRPGSGTLLVGPEVLLLLPDPGAVDVDRLWFLVSGGAQAGDVLDALAAAGLRAVPPFALAAGGLLVVRGAVDALVDSLDGAQRRISGAGVTSWVETSLEKGDLVQLGPPFEELGGLPLVVGVVLAASVSYPEGAFAHSGSAGRAPSTPSTHPHAETVLPTGFHPSLDRIREAAPDRGPVLAEAVELETLEPEALDHRESPDADGDDVPELTLLPASEGTVRQDAPDLVSGVPGSPPSTGADDSYDHLWGATVMRSVEEAAVPEGADPPEAGARDVDHDGHTVLVSQVRRDRSRSVTAAATSPPPDGPTVLAVPCLAGHVNPPGAEVCSTCGADVAGIVPRRVSRPVLGRLRFSHGVVVDLDRPVLVGRSPTARRFSGSDLPHLVSVDSPQQDISRTHLEVRLEGWDVLVADMSTNGTVIARPGQKPQRLHPGEAVLVLPGTSFDLGEGVTAVLEAP